VKKQKNDMMKKFYKIQKCIFLHASRNKTIFKL
jgi:hypothetical protein